MASSFEIRPFAFDRIFSLEPEAAPTSGETSFETAQLRLEMNRQAEAHAAELARVRAEAFQAGLDHARTERENALLSAMDALYAGFETHDEEQQRFRDMLVRDAAELALRAAETLAGHALGRYPGQAIDDAIGEVLGRISRGQDVHIRVHPDLVEDIEGRIATRQSKDRRRLNLSVSPDPDVPLGDALFDWERGGMALDAEARREAIRAELMAVIATPGEG